MTTYSYSAIDAQGREKRGTIQVKDQPEALQRIKNMGFYPVKLAEVAAPLTPAERIQRHARRLGLIARADRLAYSPKRIRAPRARVITLFTRQLATLLDAGMPLLRGLRLLEEQEESPNFKIVITGLASAIEGGNSFSKALAQYPKIFDRLYLNLIKAGEMAGMLEMSLRRVVEFREKSARIKGKVKAAMFYPIAVMTVATGVMALLLIFIVPRFEEVFKDLGNGRPLPAFTRFVLGVSETIRDHFVSAAIIFTALYGLFLLLIRTVSGRRAFDLFKLRMAVFGPVFRKVAIARFTRTFGTMSASGVPLLQALAIIKEATGNVIVGGIVGRVRDNVEQGESIAAPLRESNIFPAMVVGMVQIGEQTGSLPEMLNKIADTYDEEVDNSVTAMTSLLEPIMIVLLGIVVGSIVIAMFLPILHAFDDPVAPGEPSL